MTPRARSLVVGAMVALAVAQAAAATAFAAGRRPEASQPREDPVAQYNTGTQAYLKGEYDRAADSLNRALSQARAGLQGRASYNLGNTRYRQAQKQEPRALAGSGWIAGPRVV